MTGPRRPEDAVPDETRGGEPAGTPLAATTPDAAPAEPVVEAPSVEAPVVDEPVVEPAADEPVARQAVDGPAVDEPAVAGTGSARLPVRRRDPLAAALIGVLTLLLGFAFAVQVRSNDAGALYDGAREEDLVRILDELNNEEDRLRAQIAEQRGALQDLTSSDSRTSAALEEARQEAEAIGILNGTLAAEGPGLVMSIRDPASEVRVADVLDAIQELRGAGAETMQIDDVRVGVSTAVSGEPGSLLVDGRPITAPYEFVVIGDPQNMETALNIPGGVVQRIANRGGSVAITQQETVDVDALRQLDDPQYASPQTDG